MKRETFAKVGKAMEEQRELTSKIRKLQQEYQRLEAQLMANLSDCDHKHPEGYLYLNEKMGVWTKPGSEAFIAICRICGSMVTVAVRDARKVKENNPELEIPDDLLEDFVENWEEPEQEGEFEELDED